LQPSYAQEGDGLGRSCPPQAPPAVELMSKQTRQRVRDHFGDWCAYCRSPVGLFPGAGQIDHIVPPGAGGSDDEENLCLYCAWCNLRKSDQVLVRDPVTLMPVCLFHPRAEKWEDYFRWSDS